MRPGGSGFLYAGEKRACTRGHGCALAGARSHPDTHPRSHTGTLGRTRLHSGLPWVKLPVVSRGRRGAVAMATCSRSGKRGSAEITLCKKQVALDLPPWAVKAHCSHLFPVPSPTLQGAFGCSFCYSRDQLWPA